MKMGLKYSAKIWMYHLLMMIIALLFISGMEKGWISLLLNAMMLIGVGMMAFNEGAYNGEKACTLAVTLEKQLKEGRTLDDKVKEQVFNRKHALWLLIFGALPLLLVSTVNVATAPFYPEVVIEQAVEEETTTGDFSFDYDEAVAKQENMSVNPVNVFARLVFMPFVSTFTLVRGNVLNVLFFLYSLFLPGVTAAGYLTGPRMRAKKLKDIALGKKRKMRNLKVNKKPRQPKAEV